MRKLYLVNEVGTAYYFDYRTGTLIASIADIGFQKDNTYITYKNTYTKVDEKNPQVTLEFGLVFLAGYQGYTDFLKYVRESKELRLFYEVNHNAKYVYVAFKSITKTQLEYGTLQCKLVLDKLSLWQQKKNYEVTIGIVSGGKVYPYTYPYTYAFSYAGQVLIQNDGEVNAPLNIEIEGAVSNPRIEIYSGDDLVSTMQLYVSSTNCKIQVHAEETNQYMVKIENGIETNIYQLQDFNFENFLFIPNGSFKLIFNPGVTSNSICRIEVVEGYSGQ